MGTGVGEMMLMSAAMGGGTAAITGGDPLKGALLGGLTGGLGAGISNAMSAAQPLANAGVSAGANAAQTATTAATQAGQLGNSYATLGNAAANTANAGNAAVNTANVGANVAKTGINAAGTAPNAIANFGANPAGAGGTYSAYSTGAAPDGISGILSKAGMPQQTLDPSIFGNAGQSPTSLATPYTTSTYSPSLNESMDLARAQNMFDLPAGGSDVYSQLTNPMTKVDMRQMAYQPKLGGANAVNTGGISDLAGGDKFSLKEFLKTSGKGPSLYEDPYEYIKEHKMPAISAALAGSTATKKLPEEEEYDGPLSRFRFNPATYRPAYFADGGIAMLAAGGYDRQVGEDPYPMRMASGGISDLGGYSDGGRMLQGPGDGMSDSIPASISGKRPARLADGEFVVPADVVSHLGNGSTDAGAKQLYSMMDKVRTARTGKKKQARAVTPQKYMPA